MKRPLPTEHQEQAALMAWAALAVRQCPELELLFAVPNAGKRTPRQGTRMRQEGLKRGVPDLHLPVARNGAAGLWIEMKRGAAKPTAEQLRWHGLLRAQGHRVEICRSAQEGILLLREYLSAA